MTTATPTPTAPMSPADRLAHDLASHVRLSPEIHRAVVRYGICLTRFAELKMRDRLTPAEYDAMADAQTELTRLHEQLEAAGLLHLVVTA